MENRITQLQEAGQLILDSQPFSRYLCAELIAFQKGQAILALIIRDDFLQQHGFVHGGVISYLIDHAITFAGGSVLGEKVVTAEYKVNYTRPARGQRLVATATVESFGLHLAVCRCEVLAINGDKEKCCAIGQGTVARLGK